jgi:glycosyltransferase involved in cell wall biosynthesis
MKKLIVQLVTWNGAKYIPFLFESLRAQTYTNWELVILDNGSSDDTPEVLQREVGNLPVYSVYVSQRAQRIWVLQEDTTSFLKNMIQNTCFC